MSSHNVDQQAVAPDFLTGGGEMGALMRAHDWTKSPLGPPEAWPQSLRAVVALMINSRYPMFVAWGADLAFLYNDGYAPIFGKKHPSALGLPFRQVWSEIWDDIRPLVERALAGEATYEENLHLVMERNGYPEDTWYSFSYSPVRDESGGVAGMFCACTETTQNVLAERRKAEERERLARMFQQAPGFITILNGPEHRFEFVNDAYVRLFGDRAFVGKTVREVFPELAGQGFYEWLDRVYTTGERFVASRVPIRLERADGISEERFLDFIYAPVTDEQGAISGVFCEGHDVTEAHNSREALAASEERFRLATEAAEVGFWDVDTVNDLLIWPPRVKAMFGISADVPVSMADFYNGLHPDDREHTQAAFAAAADPDKRALYDVEYRTVGKEDGLIRWVAAKGRGVFDPAGRCVRVVGTAIDITARRQTEAALRESEARVSALADNLPAGMIFQIATGVDGSERRFLYVSQSHEKLTGVPAAEVLADPTIPYNLIVPEDRARLAQAEAEAIRSKTPFDIEAGFRRTDGELRWSRILSAPRVQPDGSIIWDGIQIDTTEQKRGEAALRESEARFRLMADAVPAIVWVTDAEGRVEFFNRQWFDYTGADPKPTSADQVSDNHVHPDDGDATMAAFNEARRTGTTYIVEHRIRSKAGAYRWFLVRGEPHRDAETGEIVRWFGASVDIHDRREAEAALNELNEKLESRVSERTAELEQAHEQLRQSQKMEAMGALTGGVAHDFNNLLTPIVGSLDLLQRRELGGERERRLIDGALQSAERARLLVQRLLAFARRQPLQPRPVDISALVSGMADLVASTTGPQIKVGVDIADELPAAVADPNQVEMAILNLSVNARDAMPDGGTLRISADAERIGPGHRSRLRPGHYVRLSVADTGSGMDEMTLARAVEPFFSTKGVGRGTGLGLSMVHGLASQLGGALTIESRLGLGTNVEIWLPASVIEPDEQRASEEARASVEAEGTALLVDDEELVRASTADMLGELGYAVVEAGSAEEALRLVDRGLAPDLLVTDHLMPGMNGTDLARELRARRPSLRVLLVSGYAEAEGVAPDLARLIKPFRQADLVEKLSALDEVSR